MNPNFDLPKTPEPLDSKEALVAKAVAKYIPEGITSDQEAMEIFGKSGPIQRILRTKGEISMPGVIKILRENGIILPVPAVPKEKKKTKEPEVIKIETPKIGTNLIQDETLQGNVLAARKTTEREIEKKEIIIEGDVSSLYNKTPEPEEYYYEFSKYYSRQEIEKDMSDLEEREAEFKTRENPENVKSQEIATMTEVALEHAVSRLKWYGDNVKIQPTSKFDDVKRRVDGVLEILDKDKGSNFMGLGIDVTYRGLSSEQFKKKFFTLLQGVQENRKTKVKYFKRHDGKMMKEFAVPKVILSLDFGDVKNMAYYLKNIKNPNITKEFKNSSLKFEIMNQIIKQCDILNKYAKKCENNISEEYAGVRNSIDKLAENNIEIKTMLGVIHDDPVSKHLADLVKEFELEGKVLKEKTERNFAERKRAA